MRVLLERGVPCNTRGFLGATAVSRACRSGRAAPALASRNHPFKAIYTQGFVK